MVEAEALAPLVLAPVADFDVSDFVASDALDFGASAFIVSEEEPAGGVELEAAGGLELEPGLDGDGDCAKADDSINPLSVVVSNSFFNIGKTSMQRGVLVMASGHGI